MSMKFAGSRVALTGAESGIGRATALACARAGAAVLAIDIDGGAAAASAEAWARLGSAGAAYTCDVTDYDAMSALAGRIESEHGPVDVLVNNAGVGVAGPLLDHSIEDWRWLRSVNIDGVVHGAHAFGARMVQRGHGRGQQRFDGRLHAPGRPACLLHLKGRRDYVLAVPAGRLGPGPASGSARSVPA